MLRPNIDFIRYSPWNITTWSFYFRGKARRVTEEYEEVLDIAKKTLELTGDYFKPTGIQYKLEAYPEDISVFHLFDHLSSHETKTMPHETIIREIHSDKTLTFEDLINDIDQAKVRVEKSIRFIKFYRGKTRFVLEGKDEYIDKNSKDLYREMTGESGDIPKEPMTISIYQSRTKEESAKIEISDPAYYMIEFESYTDIWFERNNIGQANRDRLKKVLKAVYDSFDVVYAGYLSDGGYEYWIDIIPILES